MPIKNIPLSIPTHFVSPFGALDGERVKPVKFGTELEGLIDLGPGYPLDQYALLGRLIGERTGILASEKQVHLHNLWRVKSDETIKALRPYEMDWCKTEVTSRALSGHRGLTENMQVFDALYDLGLRTNESCDLHVSVSLGWGFPIGRGGLEEVKNVYKAFVKNRKFFWMLVDPRQQTNPYCNENDYVTDRQIDACTNINELEHLAGNGKDRRRMLNVFSIKKHGVLEYRMKEADNYTDASGYIAFLVAFTCAAAANPHVTPHDVVEKYSVPSLPIGSRDRAGHYRIASELK